MLDRQSGRIIVSCDMCPDAIESERDEDFTTFWNRAKRDGWSTSKVQQPRREAEWLHGCPDCGKP